LSNAYAGFEANLDDDLNISGALGEVFNFVRDTNRLISRGELSSADAARAIAALERFDSVIGVLPQKAEALDSEVQSLIDERIAARKSKDFAKADSIRNHLLELGIMLEDTPRGTVWKRKL